MDLVLPKFLRKELDEYLECGLLCRGFARLRCSETCKETRLVGFSYTLAKCQFCPTTSSIPERAMPVQAGPPQKTPWWIAAYSPLSLRRLLMQPGAGHNRPSDPPDHDPFDF